MIGTAYAQAAGGATGNEWLSLLPMIAIFVVFYFLLIRPQQKRVKEQRAMIEALQKGDEIVTAGGIVGRITKLDENYISLETAGGTTLAVQRSAVSALLPKGSLKNL